MADEQQAIETMLRAPKASRIRAARLLLAAIGLAPELVPLNVPASEQAQARTAEGGPAAKTEGAPPKPAARREPGRVSLSSDDDSDSPGGTEAPEQEAKSSSANRTIATTTFGAPRLDEAPESANETVGTLDALVTPLQILLRRRCEEHEDPRRIRAVALYNIV